MLEKMARKLQQHPHAPPSLSAKYLEKLFALAGDLRVQIESERGGEGEGGKDLLHFSAGVHDSNTLQGGR